MEMTGTGLILLPSPASSRGVVASGRLFRDELAHAQAADLELNDQPVDRAGLQRESLHRQAPRLLTEPSLIRRRPVERRDGNVVEPQIDGQLAPMVSQVIEGAVA
jgi:hypothetical protein